jgi:hypothetical protein
MSIVLPPLAICHGSAGFAAVSTVNPPTFRQTFAAMLTFGDTHVGFPLIAALKNTPGVVNNHD